MFTMFPFTLLQQFVAVVLLVAALRRADARLDAAAILPHGDVAIDPSYFDDDTKPLAQREAAAAIAQGSAAVGDWMGRHINPDVLFLSSPHGIALTTDLGVYLGETASGGCTIGQDEPNATRYTVRLPSILLESRLSKQLVSEGIKIGHRVSGVLEPEETTLYWGEVIPLLLIPPRFQPNEDGNHLALLQRWRRLLLGSASTSIRSRVMNTAYSSKEPRHHMILSFPLRRYTDAPAMVPELLRWGHFVRQFLDASIPNISVGVVISGDLSHTHQQDGPYGYSNASAPFDAAIGRWAENPCSQQGRHALLQEARALQPQALSCGFTGFVMLHGMLCGCCNSSDSYEDTADPWISDVKVNRNVTYFGMLAATFERK